MDTGIMIAKLLARNNRTLILGSGSPRRKQYLEDLGVPFETRISNVSEVYPKELKAEEIAIYLAELKFESLEKDLIPNELLVTADTVVWCEGVSLEKPANKADAKQMLEQLSGKTHVVFSAVCIGDRIRRWSSCATTEVTFRSLFSEEIDFYITHFEPYDKAGGYGIQEWIGLVGITHLSGSYPGVVGLPTALFYQGLISFLEE